MKVFEFVGAGGNLTHVVLEAVPDGTEFVLEEEGGRELGVGLARTTTSQIDFLDRPKLEKGVRYRVRPREVPRSAHQPEEPKDEQA